MKAISDEERRLLERFERCAVNYDDAHPELIREDLSWTIEQFSVAIAPEAPGPPEPAGSVRAAREVLSGFEFVDPGLIRVVFDPATELVGRTLLLRIRVWFLARLDIGARIVERIDRDAGDEAIWGFAYRTLEGHIEQGELAFRVVKQKQSGAVRVELRRSFKVGRFDRWHLRVGARLLGRHLQMRYVRYALRRIPEMVLDVRARLRA